jgi:hypothetical protein
MSLEFTGFRVAVLGLYWVFGYRQKKIVLLSERENKLWRFIKKKYNLRSDYLLSGGYLISPLKIYNLPVN